MREMHIEASAEALERFDEYARLLAAKNSMMNLIGSADTEEIAVRHFADSLSLVLMGLETGAATIDIGTGAGFPGIPVKIVRPDIKITLLDSLGKRVEFLKEVVDALGLEDVCVVNARAEEAALSNDYREKFDYAFSRAVAGMSVLAELCLPFVKCGGMMCAMKSMNIDGEMQGARRAADILGGKMIEPYRYSLPLRDIRLQIIRIEKVAPTPGGVPPQICKNKTEASLNYGVHKSSAKEAAETAFLFLKPERFRRNWTCSDKNNV